MRHTPLATALLLATTPLTAQTLDSTRLPEAVLVSRLRSTSTA